MEPASSPAPRSPATTIRESSISASTARSPASCLHRFSRHPARNRKPPTLFLAAPARHAGLATGRRGGDAAARAAGRDDGLEEHSRNKPRSPSLPPAHPAKAVRYASTGETQQLRVADPEAKAQEIVEALRQIGALPETRSSWADMVSIHADLSRIPVAAQSKALSGSNLRFHKTGC